MKKNIAVILAISLVFTMASCKKWLEINPEDRIMEEKLFSNREGFITALNGVYIEMNNTTLYGGNMQVDIFDVMAQYYLTKGEHAYQYYAKYDYEQASLKSTFDNIWIQYYKQIANCNTIIEQCDLKKGMLGEEYYNLIKGEALGLKAFFHFELLKIFGPVFSEDREMISIPYRETAELVITPLLKASEVKERIIRDFTEAEELLAKSDPVIHEGPLFSENPAGNGNDFRYRTVRLNYYAVQALIARASLYFGDKIKAAEYAGKVIKEVHTDKNWFPFILESSNPQTDDRVYQSELLFATYNMKKPDIFKNRFSNSLNDLGVLRMDETMLDHLFETGDYRFRHQWETLKNPDDKQQLYFIKYKDVTVANNAEAQLKTYRYLVPLVRIIEMYYIMAEVEPNTSKALEYLNKARSARNLPDITGVADIDAEIEKEYRREFAGEGQLFFYYKRLARQEIPDGNNPQGKIQMNTERYVIPIPDSEKNSR